MSVKKVCGNIYAHKSNWYELSQYIPLEYYSNAIELWRYANDILAYDVIKYNTKDHKISFIRSIDWEIAKEPIVGNSYTFEVMQDKEIQSYVYKTTKGRTKNFQIYHCKEEFVDQENYDGFDVEQAKQRTIEWNAIPDIRKHKSKIGNQDYWLKLLDEHGIEH